LEIGLQGLESFSFCHSCTQSGKKCAFHYLLSFTIQQQKIAAHIFLPTTTNKLQKNNQRMSQIFDTTVHSVDCWSAVIVHLSEKTRWQKMIVPKNFVTFPLSELNKM